MASPTADNSDLPSTYFFRLDCIYGGRREIECNGKTYPYIIVCENQRVMPSKNGFEETSEYYGASAIPEGCVALIEKRNE